MYTCLLTMICLCECHSTLTHRTVILVFASIVTA
uniref:Uncharacterized protein n=1 Tax=Siphoviridae sp. ctmIh35 TaxID=2827932 RepID=A0A8S5T8N0_9CAUD|nr:MAG TPA: hypothetical protein [Siphoviridae sp. ctmIh35]